MFQTWALEKKGPVMVSMFNPMQTVGTVIFSVLFLGSAMQLGRYWKVPDSPTLLSLHALPPFLRVEIFDKLAMLGLT
jgi:hypothetical protein